MWHAWKGFVPRHKYGKYKRCISIDLGAMINKLVGANANDWMTNIMSAYNNAHILSKRRTRTPIIRGVKGLFCGFVTSKCRSPLSKYHIPFWADLIKSQFRTSYVTKVCRITLCKYLSGCFFDIWKN